MSGIVYRLDGGYLKYSESTTHTGTHYKFEWVDYLQDATVLYGPLPYILRPAVEHAEKLPAKETREVHLL